MAVALKNIGKRSSLLHRVTKVGKDLLGGSCTVPSLPPAHPATSPRSLLSPRVSPGQEDDKVVVFKEHDNYFSLKFPPSDLSPDVVALVK